MLASGLRSAASIGSSWSPAAARSAATGCVPPPRPAAAADTGLAVPTALRSRPDHLRPGATPSPAPQPPARPLAWPDRSQTRGMPQRPAAASPPAPSTRRPSSHRHAHALGLPGPARILRPATTAASRAVTFQQGVRSLLQRRDLTAGIKEPGSRGSQALQTGTGRRTVLWHMSGPRTGWRRSYAALQVKATLHVMPCMYLILLNQSCCQTDSMKSTACFRRFGHKSPDSRPARSPRPS